LVFISGGFSVVNKYLLPGDIEFSPLSVAPGGTFLVTFAPITGAPSASTSITLYLVGGQTSASTPSSSASLSRQASGEVFFDNFNRSSL
jgi:hypothetical protein